MGSITFLWATITNNHFDELWAMITHNHFAKPWSTITHDHFAKPWSTLTHDHILTISRSAITIMIGDHFADHHYGYIESKICISICQFFENLLKYIFFHEIRISWKYFSKLVIFQRSVIADHFMITHKIYDLWSLTIMIGKNWKNMIYDHSWLWSDRKWSAITIRYA